jgi:hypothetical protein
MAKQTINIGTTANDGTGDQLRSAFDKVNDNFTELYSDDAGDVGSIVAGTGISVNQATGAVTVTNSSPDQTVALTGGTSISTSGTYPNFTITNDSPNATHTGDVTGGAALTIASSAVTTAKINNDAITHDKLENRYTAIVTKTDQGGAVAVDWSAGTIFKFSNSLTSGLELDFTNYKAGQIISIYGLTGSQTITLDSDAGTSETFNKVGGVDYAGGSTNLLQIECVDDSANAVFNYSVATYASDATPS